MLASVNKIQKAKDKTMDSKQIKEQIAKLQEQLAEAEAAEAIIPEADFLIKTGDEEKKVNEDEWLPADDLAEGEEEIAEAQYADNTVGAFIDVLRRKCKMEDVLLPRLNPEKKELLVFDVYSKAGRAVIDFAVGRVDDPKAI